MNFALQSREQVVLNLRITHEKEIAPVDGKSWKEYWILMGKKGTWVNHIFIQMTAWCMTLDILNLRTASQSENPFIHISGNIRGDPDNNSRPPLILGNYTNVNYQSLLCPISHFFLPKIAPFLPKIAPFFCPKLALG